MIEILGTILPIVIYSLLTILIIVGIVLGIKIIVMVDAMNRLTQDLENKIATFDKLFGIFYNTSTKIGNTFHYGLKIWEKVFK